MTTAPSGLAEEHAALHEKNRRSWNAATRAHNSHKPDQGAFLRDGGSTLFAEELELLGPLRGKRLLHLLCNSGQDTLSLARLGAEVTGVDISDEAISTARALSRESGVPATFHRADVFPWLRQTVARAEEAPEALFDVVFASYGALPWLSDLSSWVRDAAKLLKPGGRFVIMEFHPLAYAFDEEGRIAYDVAGGELQVWEEGVGDYVQASGEGLTPQGSAEGIRSFENPHPSYEFSWGLGEIMSSFLDASLRVEIVREYRYVNGWKALPYLEETPERRFVFPPDRPKIPLMFGLLARRET